MKTKIKKTKKMESWVCWRTDPKKINVKKRPAMRGVKVHIDMQQIDVQGGCGYREWYTSIEGIADIYKCSGYAKLGFNGYLVVFHDREYNKYLVRGEQIRAKFIKEKKKGEKK